MTLHSSVFSHCESHCYSFGPLGSQAMVVEVDGGVSGLQVVQEVGHWDNAQTHTALEIGSSSCRVILLPLLWRYHTHIQYVVSLSINSIAPLAATSL